MKKQWFNTLLSYSYPTPPVEKLFTSFRRSFATVAVTSLVVATTGAMASDTNHDRNNARATISVSDGKDTVAAGGSLRYVVKVTQNAGTVRTSNVVLNLPSYVTSVNPDGGARVLGNRVIWDRVRLVEGEEKILLAQVTLAASTPLDTVLTATAQVDSVEASDTTTVRSGSANDSFRLSITDNRDSVYPGQSLSYVLTVKNTAASTVTTDVSAVVSGLSTIDSSSPSAVINYPTVIWKDVTFKAGETRTFTFTAAMRKRVSPYTAARVVAHVLGLTATDTTVAKSLKGDPVFMTSTQLNGSSRSTSSSSRPTNGRNPLFTNVSDAVNVVRGGTIHYTLTVQNVLLNTIKDATVSVRFDPAQLSAIDLNGGTLIGDNRIQWKVPALQPGQVWKMTYAMRVSKTLPNGASITNVASLSGNDVGDSTLSDRVTVTTADVLVNLPATGGAFDLLFTLMTAPLAFAGMAAQRRLR